MLVPILICSVSNTTMALAVGLFLNILLALAAGGGFYALACYGMMTVLGAVLSQALKEKRYRIWLAVLFLLLNLLLPDVLYYLSYKEIAGRSLLYGAGNGIVTALCAYFVFGRLWQSAVRESDNQLLDIVSEDFSEVKALKEFFYDRISACKQGFRHCISLCKAGRIARKSLSCRGILLPHGAMDGGALCAKWSGQGCGLVFSDRIN